MGATKLTCKECGAEYGLEARYVCDRCFGPLEVAYEHDIQRRRARCAGASRAGRRTSGAITTSCRSRARSRAPAPACPPAARRSSAPTASPQRLGMREVWVKNDAANPTHSFKDRVVSVASTRARELGFTTLACASTGNLANSVAAHGAALGHGHLRLHPVRPRGAEGPRHRHLRREGGQGQGQLRRRQPPLHRAQRRARLGLRQRQRAPVLRRGLQDARLRDRRAARLGGARPRRGADRLGLALHEDRQGLPGLPRPRPRRAAGRRS